ncbi:MAG: phosphoenolpyruvate carboxykinase [Deltaproteobacteria bacterium]|nr:phosphoenolpyruvate carboxykinase [Deltaproteobacteria bacterium]
MDRAKFKIFARKVIIYTRGKVCETPEELLASPLFAELLRRYFDELAATQSYLLRVLGDRTADADTISLFVETLQHLAKLPYTKVPSVVPGAEVFFRDMALISEFIEQLYNYWRSHDRFLLCDSEGDILDQRPYRTFNSSIETLTHLIRSVYRDIQENITLSHPRIYRQVTAGAEIAAISLPQKLQLPGGVYEKLYKIPVIRQVLINPPLILNPPMNKRTGQFVKVERNPLELVEFHQDEWLCYPARVGPLLILVYFHARFFELGFTLCNLFELAEDEDLNRQPDAVYAFGAPAGSLDGLGVFPTVFHEDAEHDLLVAAAPCDDAFGYFGYLKKMVLTLHNIKMMQAGKLPFHGAFVKMLLNDYGEKNILIIGDTGAGKSETLEALRTLGEGRIKGMFIIADDMGSLDIDEDGRIIGYGTETGAFLRLDDLQDGYAFGQIDRSIIMSPSQVNARIVLPVTTYALVMQGHRVDVVLYANNYEQVDDEHPVIERFFSVDKAFSVFREGTVMSKGTTTSSGIVHSYFANIFGPAQYREVHDRLAMIFFNAFFSQGVFVGQMRTCLGIAGYETDGPARAAEELLERLQQVASK